MKLQYAPVKGKVSMHFYYDDVKNAVDNLYSIGSIGQVKTDVLGEIDRTMVSARHVLDPEWFQRERDKMMDRVYEIIQNMDSDDETHIQTS